MKIESKSVRITFLFDVMLNLFASALPIAVLQLFVYPQTAKILGGDKYGLMLTIYSVWILVANAIGNSLNNVKLLRNDEYIKNGLSGDFPILLKRFSCYISVICFFVIWFYFGNFSILHILFGVVVALFIYLKAYFEVGFRINLNYKMIAIINVFLTIGFIIGFGLTSITGYWEFIFLCGYGISCILCILKSGLIFEKSQKTKLYKRTKFEFYSLLAASVIGFLTTYADKLVLYPLIGGTAVSIYYTATILGKIISMITGPLNNVILSYISKWKADKKSILIYVLLFGVILIVIGYFITIIVGGSIIGYLFPQWKEDVLIYLPVTTITVMLQLLISLIYPFTLKYCAMKWQIIFSIIGSIVYFGCALLLWNFYGLMGFCIGTVMGESCKLFVMLLVYKKSK